MSNEAIKGLLTSEISLKKEYSSRSSDFMVEAVPHKLVEDYIDERWEVYGQPSKRKTKLRKLKEFDERHENNFWCLLHKLGYKELNEGRSFKIKIERPPAATLEKQIDIFAKDDETVIVAECKACNKLTKRKLQKDIEEFANLKKPIANQIVKHYDTKLKIIWFFVTKNINWSKNDRERAEGENIKIITEKELNYYWTIAQHIGPSARYQFLAEFLRGQKIPELSEKKVPAIRGRLGGRVFYSFVTTPKQLLKISFVNHRMLNDPDGAPSYQRLIEKKRLHKIGNYIKKGGYFPTNILINFVNKCRFDISHKDDEALIQYGQLYLPDLYRSAWIIDGQHRLYSYSGLEEKFQLQNIVVIAFENMNKAEEANLFVTINHEQKSVAKGLIDELEGELKWGSAVPGERLGALSSRLVSVLSNDVNQPFYLKVSAAGEGKKKEKSLTVTGVKEGLLKSGLIGKVILNNKEYEPGYLCGLNDSDTIDRARSAVNYYFDQLREANYALWDAGREGFLCNNTGIHAHFLVIQSVISHYEKITSTNIREISTEDLFEDLDFYFAPLYEYYKSATINSMQEEFKVQYGSTGPRQYFYRLCKIINNVHSDFMPDGFLEWVDTQNKEKIIISDNRLKEINSFIINSIGETFKANFSGDTNYMEKALGKKKTDVYMKMVEKRAKDGKPDVPLEGYLDFIDFKKIVEIAEYWPLFKGAFNIPEPGEKGVAKNIKWIERLNELRRIPAHSSELRNYESGDFEYIEYIYNELVEKNRNAK